MAEIMLKIDELKINLNKIIFEKGDLLDKDVIDASQKLDNLLSKYYNLVMQ